jgi:5-hydroxyisourate hydrolase-like protein (transthyretin family)
VTGADGRASALPAFGRPAPPGLSAPPGQATCRLVFAVGDYLVAHHGAAFFPEITVVFAAEAGEHYHVPLLLTPYGYSVYRGS